jgi:AcrR family transcriptional regulator
MRGHGEKKSRKLDAFIAGLLSRQTVEDAAAAAGISTASAYRWMRDPDVVERLRQARREAWGRAMAQLQEAGPEAVESLRKILREAEGESPRVSAARTILELGVRVVELGDIEERIEKLEAIVKSNWKGKGLDNEQPDRAQVGGTRGVNGRA